MSMRGSCDKGKSSSSIGMRDSINVGVILIKVIYVYIVHQEFTITCTDYMYFDNMTNY